MGTIIRLETEHAWHVDAQLKNSLVDLQNLHDRLISDRSRLERAWESPSAKRYLSELEKILGHLNEQVARLNRLEIRLGREIEEWITVDQGRAFGAVASLGGRVSSSWGSGYYAGGGAGGGGGGALGSDHEVDAHRDYLLLRGLQIQTYEKYMRGEMTWEEAMQVLKKEWEKDPFKPDWVKIEGEIWKAEGSVEGSVYGKSFFNNHLNVDFLGYELEGSGGLVVNENGLEGKIEGEASVSLAKLEGNGEYLGVAAAGVAYVGANAAGSGHVNLNPLAGKVGAGAEVDAFIGGKAEGSLSRNFEDLGIPAGVNASGAVSYGVGVNLDADVGYDQGVFSFEFETGIAVGLGLEAGVGFTVDVPDAARKVADLGQDVVAWMW